MFKNILVVVNEQDFENPDVKRLVNQMQGIFKNKSVTITIPKFLCPELYKGKDLALSIGGDNTNLVTSSFIESPDCYIYGINPNPARSIGYLSNKTGIELNKLESIINGDFSSVKRERAAASLNGVIYPPALNEILFGVDGWGESAATYELGYRGKKERQRSNGVIIATPSGSTGMFQSEGGEPFNFKQGAEYLRFIVSGKYCHGGFENIALTKGDICKGEVIRFYSESRYNAALKQDGKKLADIKKGDVVEVSLSDMPLNVICS